MQSLGFVLQQQFTVDKWILVQAGSHFLSSAESRYAIIELGTTRGDMGSAKVQAILAGLLIVTDHNPLIQILNSHRLDEVKNSRLQLLRTKLMAFNFTAAWCKGTTNQAPDALSRNPIWNLNQQRC